MEFDKKLILDTLKFWNFDINHISLDALNNCIITPTQNTKRKI